MVVSLINDNIPKILEKNKLIRDFTMLGGKGKLQIHFTCHTDNAGGVVTTNSGTMINIKLLEPINLQNLGGGISVKRFGVKSQICQRLPVM